MTKQVFKPYNKDQMTFLPIDLGTLIPQNHMVRVIDKAIDQMDMTAIFNTYKGGGTSAYHPVMLLKVLVYAYADKIYSSRQIAKATRDNVNFLWLTGNTKLDFMTINRFRSERLNGTIEKVFAEVVELLHKEKYVDLDKYFLDGTKIESAANKYSWVWGKNTQRFKAQLQNKVMSLFKAIDIINDEENKEYAGRDLSEVGLKPIDSNAIEEAVKKIDERLSEKPKDKILKKAKTTIEKDYLPRMQKYEEQEEILKERRSYSKTDTDATFMRMKEDHMKNGQLKPAYNVQMGTENQFITGYSIHQVTTDTTCTKEHLENLSFKPKTVIADAGYGSEENYEYFEEKEITAYVKYGTFHKEKSKKWLQDITKSQNFIYDEKTDTYYCPAMKRPLVFMYEQKQKSINGFVSEIRVYECLNCSGCPHREKCVKGESEFANRRLYKNPKLEGYKAKANELLTSEMGTKLRGKRCVEVESVFGDIKGNFGLRRFSLRGKNKVKIEYGLWAIAHNMRKMARIG